MLACTLTSYAVAATQLVPLHPIKSRRQLLKVTALSLVFCLTVVLGNVSLRFIPVSFNQAVGSTTPAWVAALSLLMLRQRESRGTYLSLIPVVVGIIIASGAEPLFNAIGFFAAMSATGARAFKSVLQGAMLSDPSEKMDSMSLLSYMAPIAALSLVPLALYYEPEAMANAITLGQDGSEWRGAGLLGAASRRLPWFGESTGGGAAGCCFWPAAPVWTVCSGCSHAHPAWERARDPHHHGCEWRLGSGCSECWAL